MSEEKENIQHTTKESELDESILEDTPLSGSEKKEGESYWERVSRQFKKNRIAVYSLRFIYALIFIALFADFLANEKPLVAKYQDEIYFPVLKGYAVDLDLADWPEDFQNADWHDLDFEWSVFPPIPYSPTNIDIMNSQFVGPFEEQNIESNRWRHWLGTDNIGHDVLSGMIHGTRIALLVGLVSMGIATLIGIFLGSIAGYFGDNRLKITLIGLILNIVFIIFGLFYAFGSRGYLLSDALGESFSLFMWELLLSLLLLTAFIALANLIAYFLKNVPILRKKIQVPIDLMISRLIEIMLSIPVLFLIISIAAIAKPSIFTVMAIIGLTSWTSIARFMRGELLRIRNLEYIEATHALGFSELRIIMRHAIPNALAPVLVAVAFGIAAAILIEATLSFLGIGVPAETLTWGSMLSLARESPDAWWMAIIPGVAIFITVTIYNLVGEGLTDALDPRQKK